MKFLFEVTFPKVKFGPLIVNINMEDFVVDGDFISMDIFDNDGNIHQGLEACKLFHYIYDFVDIFPAEIILEKMGGNKLTNYKLHFARPISAYFRDGNNGKLTINWNFKNLEIRKDVNFLKNVVRNILRLFL